MNCVYGGIITSIDSFESYFMDSQAFCRSSQ